MPLYRFPMAMIASIAEKQLYELARNCTPQIGGIVLAYSNPGRFPAALNN